MPLGPREFLIVIVHASLRMEMEGSLAESAHSCKSIQCDNKNGSPTHTVYLSNQIIKLN